MSSTSNRILVFGSQGLGCVAGIVGLAMGIWSCINLSCLIGGVILSIVGFCITAMEAPYCYLMFECTDKLYNLSQGVPVLVKAAMYIIAGIVPLVLCPLTAAVWLGSGLIAATGALYGVRAVKRDASEAPASNDDVEMHDSKTNLVNKE